MRFTQMNKEIHLKLLLKRVFNRTEPKKQQHIIVEFHFSLSLFYFFLNFCSRIIYIIQKQNKYESITFVDFYVIPLL